jgi:hypothetical protein
LRPLRKQCNNLPNTLEQHLFDMRKRATAATRRKPNQGAVTLPLRPSAARKGPARIPGVHIAHIGGHTAAVEQIRVYWQERGAVFMHHCLEAGEPDDELEEILARSHIVFHACLSGAGVQLGRALERYCDHAEKPLILLEENSLWALTKALSVGLPLP